MSDLLRRTLGETVVLETVLAGGLWRSQADPNQLENAILNLAVNARDAMPDGGKLTIETANARLDEAYVEALAEPVPAGQYVLVAVSDTGTGMDKATMEKVFEPFFTTKEAGKGTGLGLSQVYGFVRQSNGHVRIYSELGEGTTIKIYLPRLIGSDEEPAEMPAKSPAMVRGSGETILVVEDEPDLRAYTVEALRDLGYRVLEAADGREALEIVEQHPEIELLFTDVVLAGGHERARARRRGCQAQARPAGSVHDRVHLQRHRPPWPPRSWDAPDRQALHLCRARLQGEAHARRRLVPDRSLASERMS